MVSLKSRYRKYADGGAVAADDVVMPDVRTLQTDAQLNTLEGWKKAGMPDEDLAFFEHHLELVDDPVRATAACAAAYKAGYKPKTNEFYHAVKANFYGGPKPEPLPQPKPPFDDGDYAPSRGAITSAPVGRSVPSVSGRRYDQYDMRVNLSQAEKEAARISGIDEQTYAEQKLRLLREKEFGNYTGGQ